MKLCLLSIPVAAVWFFFVVVADCRSLVDVFGVMGDQREV